MIDEFHHAAAPSYQELLEYYRPKILQSHYGSAPVSIVWNMKEPLPGFVMKKTAKV
ncbi:MAG: hypothetical protein PHV03_11285 [Desulfitobacteriaceae bacterium]|nr:hypothetical protein [Desulfitobacteriaceae bacterium]